MPIRVKKKYRAFRCQGRLLLLMERTYTSKLKPIPAQKLMVSIMESIVAKDRTAVNPESINGFFI